MHTTSPERSHNHPYRSSATASATSTSITASFRSLTSRFAAKFFSNFSFFLDKVSSLIKTSPPSFPTSSIILVAVYALFLNSFLDFFEESWWFAVEFDFEMRRRAWDGFVLGRALGFAEEGRLTLFLFAILDGSARAMGFDGKEFEALRQESFLAERKGLPFRDQRGTRQEFLVILPRHHGKPCPS